MLGEEESGKRVVFMKPFSLGDEEHSDYAPSNLLRRLLCLFTNVRPGSDLTYFQLPPQLNLPKSHLQGFGELVYSFNGRDLLGECNRSDRPIQRLKSVLSLNISTLRPLIFGMSPYNPVLGETHHVSNGNLHVLVEQVSHHPPVCALQAFHEKENIEMIYCQYYHPKFRGSYVEVEVKGRRTLNLRNRQETYEMNGPNAVMRLLPVPGAYWTGKLTIKCVENGLEAELNLPSNSIFGIRGNGRSIKGKIFESSSRTILYEIYGHWDRAVTARDVKTGEMEVIYNGKEHLKCLKTPIVRNLEEVRGSESTVVWSEVSEAIMAKEWERARVAKRVVEERQRECRREREASGKTWVPRHFSVSRNGDDWNCSPLHPTVPPAPIIVPL